MTFEEISDEFYKENQQLRQTVPNPKKYHVSNQTKQHKRGLWFRHIYAQKTSKDRGVMVP